MKTAGRYRKVRCGSNWRVSREGDYFGGLEPYDGKLSRTVLRGERSRKAPDLPGADENEKDSEMDRDTASGVARY